MTRWGAQGSADDPRSGRPGPGASDAGDEDEPTVDRSELAATRAARDVAPLGAGEEPWEDDDATISRDALTRLREARRTEAGVEGDPHDDMTVARVELPRRRTARDAAEPTSGTTPYRLRRDARAADIGASPITAPTPARDAASVRDADTIPYATLMSLRAAAGRHAADDLLLPADVARSADERLPTWSVSLPLPAADARREWDDTEDAIPEETLPAPITHDGGRSARGRPPGESPTSAPRDDGAASGPHGRFRIAGRSPLSSPPRARRRARPGRIAVLWLAAVAAIGVAAAITVVSHVGSVSAGVGAGRGETNVLAVFAMTSQTADEATAVGGGELTALAVIDFSSDGSSVSVVSLRPDVWAAIPSHGDGTLSDAWALGGADSLRATMQQSLGIRIDHTVLLTEAGLARLAAGGGLGIVNPSELTTDRFTFPDGPLTLNASTAVDYLAADPRDLPRQQAVVDGVARLLTTGASDAASALDDAAVTQPEFGDAALERLAAQLTAVGANGIVYGIAPTSETDRDSRPVAVLDGTEWQRLRAAFAADDVAGHLRSGTSR